MKPFSIRIQCNHNNQNTIRKKRIKLKSDIKLLHITNFIIFMIVIIIFVYGESYYRKDKNTDLKARTFIVPK